MTVGTLVGWPDFSAVLVVVEHHADPEAVGKLAILSVEGSRPLAEPSKRRYSSRIGDSPGRRESG